MDKKKVYRIQDANLNRAREGIRVAEDVARLYLDNESLAKKFKSLRHRITKIAQQSFESDKLLFFRDSEGDVGSKGMGKMEGKRKDIAGVVQANLRRSQEALRVLEEFGKLVQKDSAEKFKRVRFRIYTLEKKMAQKIKI
ncbi:MAG: thiamine-phosphate pyrophosphorylase [Candidatus Zixiibacteriota bacterium]